MTISSPRSAYIYYTSFPGIPCQHNTTPQSDVIERTKAETRAENDPLPPTDQKNAKRPIFTSGGEALCFTWARKRWAASGMNHSFRVNPLVEGFVIEKQSSNHRRGLLQKSFFSHSWVRGKSTTLEYYPATSLARFCSDEGVGSAVDCAPRRKKPTVRGPANGTQSCSTHHQPLAQRSAPYPKQASTIELTVVVYLRSITEPSVFTPFFSQQIGRRDSRRGRFAAAAALAAEERRLLGNGRCDGFGWPNEISIAGLFHMNGKEEAGLRRRKGFLVTIGDRQIRYRALTQSIQEQQARSFIVIKNLNPSTKKTSGAISVIKRAIMLASTGFWVVLYGQDQVVLFGGRSVGSRFLSSVKPVKPYSYGRDKHTIPTAAGGRETFEPDTSTARSFGAVVPGLDCKESGNALKFNEIKAR
uniref:Uncharacterized protein n=1 Tax=Fagus sylvatica TaxID=28930 RepID=A0A2N9G5N7_FAGSY